MAVCRCLVSVLVGLHSPFNRGWAPWAHWAVLFLPPRRKSNYKTRNEANTPRDGDVAISEEIQKLVL